MRQLHHAVARLVEEQRRFARLLPRRPGEHPAHFAKAEARLEAAACAVSLAQAAPTAALAKEASRAMELARWAVDDVARVRFAVAAEERVLPARERDRGTYVLPIAAE